MYGQRGTLIIFDAQYDKFFINNNETNYWTVQIRSYYNIVLKLLGWCEIINGSKLISLQKQIIWSSPDDFAHFYYDNNQNVEEIIIGSCSVARSYDGSMSESIPT